MTNNYRRKNSYRLADFDYTQSGYFFVTFRKLKTSSNSGIIRNGEIVLNSIGKIVFHTIENLDQIFQAFEVDCFSIMPTHVHILLFLNTPENKIEKQTNTNIPGKNHLGRFIGAIKTRSTIKINELLNSKGKKYWQRNYHDRVVRNETELTKIREYIVQNPMKWDL